MMIKRSSGEEGVAQMKVSVPVEVKDALVALKRLKGLTHSEVTTEALRAHLGILGDEKGGGGL